jgi:hypothetical protein
LQININGPLSLLPLEKFLKLSLTRGNGNMRIITAPYQLIARRNIFIAFRLGKIRAEIITNKDRFETAIIENIIKSR